MPIRSHHWASDRHVRKMEVREFIKDNPGPDERLIIKVMTKKLRISPRAIREYISELEYEDEIEHRDHRYYLVGYEGPGQALGDEE